MNLPSLILSLFSSLLLVLNVNAQESIRPFKTEIKKWYAMNSNEIIFSGGELKVSDRLVFDPFVTGLTMTNPYNVVRFSMFLHIEQEFHYNFTKHIGFYSGIALKNIGFINRFKVGDETVKLKQRSYSIGIPVAIKVGNLQKMYVTLGAEPELMFAYKRKIFFDGDKSKKSQWFSNDVNLFNPSVFAELNFRTGGYFKVAYYLSDFLANKTQSFALPGTATNVSYRIESSQLFYVALGTRIKNMKMKKRNAATSTSI